MTHSASQPNSAFSGIPTFLRTKHCNDIETLDADYAVLGVPFDEGSPFLPGTRFGPRSIREHSLRFSSKGFYDIETDKEYLVDELSRERIVDVGDVNVLSTHTEGMIDNVTNTVRKILARGAKPIVLGGDHSISYPVVRAYDQPIHVIQFDAHLDYCPDISGWRYSNGHPFRNIHGLENVASLTQAGIRSLRQDKADVDDAKANGSRIVNMSEFRAAGPDGIAEMLPADAPCYVSIDVDALDLPIIPGCVSAEPNGMSYAELRDSLVAVAKRVNIVGFDFVEVNPSLDVGTGITSYLGANIVIEFLGHICANSK